MDMKSMILATIIAIILWIPKYIKLHSKGQLKTDADKIKESAIKEGRTIIAPLVKTVWRPDHHNSDTPYAEIQHDNQHRYMGLYSFTIDGIKYNKWISIAYEPPAQLTFYWPQNKPSKAFSDYSTPISMNMVGMSTGLIFTWIVIYWILVAIQQVQL